ncbi:MAG: TPM domain-containing protein [Thermoanaerobaculia bacterium]
MKRASLFLLPLACAGVALALPPATLVTPPAPSAWVTDEAGLLAPDVRDRIAARLKKIKESSSFLRIYVYTLKSANGFPVTEATQELYRRWRMRERESGDGLATIFLFGEERSARVMLRPAAPPRLEEAMPDIGSDLSAVFPKGAGPPDEAALLRVIDKLDTALRGDVTWLDAPPIPPDPGPVFGRTGLDPAKESLVAGAVAAASRETGREIVFAIDPPKGFDSSEQRSKKLVAAWPEKTVLVVFTEYGQVRVGLHPAASSGSLISDETETIIQEKVFQAVNGPRFAEALVRAAGEIRDAMKGHPAVRFDPRKHPWQALSGGPDEELIPLPIVLFGILLILTLAFLGIQAFLRDPVAVSKGLALGLLEGLIGGALDSIGGGGGGGGSAFSGGGGSFGGGGSTGSW